ncbi:MAG: T9SS type A sorting domain-containing protein [Lewinellaceae bacterium]|nr:T9SS type A sorting domain-containing protein [Lewinellaceae bacterium]
MRNILTLCLSILLLAPAVVLSQENTSIACADGIDNDNDGQIDCADSDCMDLPNNGCSICVDGWSFADILIEYTPGCPLADPDPTGALGVSDYNGATVDQPNFVFLGQGGSLKLGFTNNILTNSGNELEDLWIFEVGPGIEACDLALQPLDSFTLAQLQLLDIPDVDGDGYFEIGGIGGSTSGVDIDAVLPDYPAGTLKFDAVEIVDVIDDTCWGGTPGADIDAVCALRSIVLDDGNPSGINPAFDVFPNPFFSGFSIKTRDSRNLSEATFEVYDVQGRLLHSKTFVRSAEVDMKGFPAGAYFLSIRSSDFVFQKKMIKVD